MFIELPNFVSKEDTAKIRGGIAPFWKDATTNGCYARDGKMIPVFNAGGLSDVYAILENNFKRLQYGTVQQRFKPQPMMDLCDIGYEYHRYLPNEICHFHADAEFGDPSKGAQLRYASAILHLNTVQEGGELVFPSQDKKITTEEGKMVVFPPYGMFGHYTTPAKINREIIVTWFAYTDLIVLRR